MAIRRYKLSQEFLDQYKDVEPNWGYLDTAGNSLGEITFLRSYSRLKEDGSKETWAETCQRVIEGMFTIQREHCNRNRIPWDYRKAKNTAQEAYHRMFTFKWLPPGRGIANMGASFVIDDWDSTPLQNCFAGEERFITDKGIKTFAETVGTNVTVMTKNGKWVEAPVKSYGKQELVKLTLHRYNQEKVIYTTAGHRWFALEQKKNPKYVELTTDQLEEGMKLQSVYGAGLKSSDLKPSAFGIARGFVFGDGRKSIGERNSNTVTLFGDKDLALSEYFEPNNKRINNGANIPGVEYTGIPNHFFEFPDLNETKSYLYGWLAGYFAADGTMSNGGAVLTSHKRENLEFVEDVCAILGIGVNPIREDFRVTKYAPDGAYSYKIRFIVDTLSEEFFIADSHRKDYVANLKPNRDSRERRKYAWKVVSVEPTDRFEEVYCLEVPETQSFVLAGNIHTGNCAFVSTKTDFSEAMHFLMLASMNGVGVGLDTLGADKYLVKERSEETAYYEIPDTREGWAEALRMQIDSFLNGTEKLIFDYSKIRPAGALIKRFGGTASGPGALQELLDWIEERLSSKTGKTLDLVDIADIANKIGVCVVSGSSRRSAEILLGPQTDEYLDLKNYGQLEQQGTKKEIYITIKENDGTFSKVSYDDYIKLDNVAEAYAIKIAEIAKDKLSETELSIIENKTGTEEAKEIFKKLNIRDFETSLSIAKSLAHEDLIEVVEEPNMVWVPGPGAERSEWSWMSNNSVFAEVGQSYKNIAKRTLLNGEPGYVWMDVARNFGRMKDRRDNKDWRAAGVNPCSEQMLESYECCTLVETFPTRHESIDDYKKTLKVAYLYAKTVTLLPTVFERSNAIMARNRRIGLSQSGITTYIEQNSIAEWRQLCNEGYKYINGYTSHDGTYVRGLDDIYSEWLCVRESIRTTTIKPSGTISLLSGDSPGIHWNPASGHYIRRVTMGDGELLNELREAGYNVEKSVYSKDQYVVSFPIKSPFKRSESDVTIWEKVALAAEAQHWWSDNGVSVTVSFDPESEGQYIEHILSLYEGRLKTVSFLPMDKNVYQQMPYEEITAEQYEEAVSKLKPVNRDVIYKIEEEALGEKFCTTDKCLLPNMEDLEAQLENFESNLEEFSTN